MKSFKIFSFVMILAILPFVSYGQEKELPPEGGSPKDFKIPEREVLELDNGMKAVMVDYGIVPKVTIQLYVEAGPILEDENEISVASLLANLMEEGTDNYDAKALSLEFAKMGGQIGVNAGTHIISVNATVLSEFAPKAIALFAEVLKMPKLPESELERLKNNMKRQMSVARSQPGTVATQMFDKAIYGDHPYGRSLPSDEEIDSRTIEDIRNYYNEEFGARRSSLYVVGKYSESDVKAAVQKHFADWKAGPERNFPEASPNMNVELDLSDRANSPQSTIRFGIPVPDPTHPDFVALEVMDDLLGGSFSSRITSNIREDKGFTYSPFSTINSRYKSSIWYQAADVSIESTGDALLEISKEIDRLRTETPTAEELEGIQNYMAGSFVRSNSTRGGIINQLYNMDFHGLDENYLNNRINTIYGVTPEKITEVASKYLDPEKMFLMVVGDVKATRPQIEDWKKSDKKFKKVID